MIMRIQYEIDALRGRFVRCWRTASEDRKQNLSVNRNTLTRFFRGDSVTQETLEALDNWCEKEERHAARVSPDC